MATINTPTGWNGENNTKIQELMGEKKNEISETLFWDKEAILKDLKENHVKIEENVEFMWYKWKKIHIDLPSVWSFKWFKFDCFVSKDSTDGRIFNKNSGLEKKCYTVKDISDLLNAVDEYMELYWIKTEWSVDYEEELNWGSSGFVEFDTWNYLHRITGLNYYYRLKDRSNKRTIGSKKNMPAKWSCRDKSNFFLYDTVDSNANILLKLSD